MIRRPPRSTLGRSSAASDVYKRQGQAFALSGGGESAFGRRRLVGQVQRQRGGGQQKDGRPRRRIRIEGDGAADVTPVSYTHLRAHETVLDLVCRLLLEKKNISAKNAREYTHTCNHEKNRIYDYAIQS